MFNTNIFETEDMNRLSTSIEKDAVPHSSLFTSPVANKSSSSAESVSPEYYFDLPLRFSQDLSIQTGSSSSIISSSPLKQSSSQDFPFEIPTCESPQPYSRQSQIWRQRPIVGRKILGRTSQVKAMDNDLDIHLNWWQDSVTPKNYELFPRAEGDLNFANRTISPGISSVSSGNLLRSRTLSSNYPNTIHPPYNNYSNFQRPPSQLMGQGKICTFCRKNGETPMVYTDHYVKEKVGGKYIATCPILRSHKCEICGVSGDDAHTISYCPVLRRSNYGKPLPSTTVTLKNTRIKSNGRLRYPKEDIYKLK